MRMLFSLCNSAERLIRLLHHCSDQGLKITVRGDLLPDENRGMARFSVAYGEDMVLPLADEATCRGMQICLNNEEMNLELIKLILSEEGEICETQEEADLVVCADERLAECMLENPRKLVISETELGEQLKGVREVELLHAVANPFMPPPPLPEQLKPCWAKLRKRSIQSINEGLDLFSEVVAADPEAGDALLDQVAIKGGALSPGKRFELADPKTHPYAYYALLGILSRSPTGSRGAALRMGLEVLADRSNDADGPLSVITLPEIKGFAKLKQISLQILEAGPQPGPMHLSTHWQGLNTLTRLDFSSDVAVFLDVLDAPQLQQLKLRGCGISDITALAHCKSLKVIDLAGTDINDLSPLAALGGSCRELDLTRTKITSLQSLSAFKEMKRLELSHCLSLSSLSGLQQIRIYAKSFSLCGLDIASLEEMPMLESHDASFHHLAVRNLSGLSRSSALKSLYLSAMPMLEDISELELLPELEQLTIHECPQLLNYEVLGQLEQLRRVDIRVGDAAALTLPSGWPTELCELRLANLQAEHIGDLPPNFEGSLDLTTVRGLKDLRSLSGCSKVKEVKLAFSTVGKIKDFSPLADCSDLWIHIAMEGQCALYEQTITALATLPSCKLRLSDYCGVNLSGLAEISQLQALDLVHFSAITKEELQPVVAMHALNYLRFPAGSLPELGGCTFNTAAKVAKLKMQLMLF